MRYYLDSAPVIYLVERSPAHFAAIHARLSVPEGVLGALRTSLLKSYDHLNYPAIIVVHNHPSGDPTPSRDDVRVTKDIV